MTGSLKRLILVLCNLRYSVLCLFETHCHSFQWYIILQNVSNLFSRLCNYTFWLDIWRRHNL